MTNLREVLTFDLGRWLEKQAKHQVRRITAGETKQAAVRVRDKVIDWLVIAAVIYPVYAVLHKMTERPNCYAVREGGRVVYVTADGWSCDKGGPEF